MRPTKLSHCVTERVALLRERLERQPPEPTSPAWFARADSGPLDEPFHEAWMMHEGADPRVRLARAQAAELASPQPVVHPAELIVGSDAPSRIVSCRTTPFGNHVRLNLPRAELLRAEYPDEAARVDEIVAYWQQWLAENPHWMGLTCHIALGYDRVMAVGLDGLRAHVERWRDANAPAGPELASWYEALLVVVQGLSDFVMAHAVAAEEAGLAGAAGRCRHVAHEPPRSFGEALQLFYLLFLAAGGHCSPGPVDRILWPALRDDLECGAIDLAEAQELMDCLWIKLAERTAYGATIGGELPGGGDACNPLTHLCLESIRRLRLLSPRTVLRWHRGIDADVLTHACEVVAEGASYPAFVNDEAIVPAAVARGQSPAHARDYTFVGCGQVHPCGRGHGNYEDVIVNAAAPLLQALHAGNAPSSFDDLRTAWRQYFAAHVGGQIEAVNERRREAAGKAWDFARSLFTESCVERGLDWHEGGADYCEGMVDVVGLTTALDSLVATKVAVFDRQVASLGDLVQVLDEDWAGHEDLRQYMLRQVPKFGNGDAEADDFVAEEAAWVDRHIRSRRTSFGGPWGMDVIGWSGALIYGEATGATPDGRRAGESLADCAGPAQGRNVKGLTATLNSTLRLPHATAHGPLALSLRFPKEAVRGEGGVANLQAVIETYFRQGGQQLQISIASTADMRAALEHPEAYRSLMVRVGGFSAYFTQLDPRWQRDMIARSEMGL